ncbi:GAF domain-containing protein [Sphingomonas sp. ID0503]|uniref:GAF domain-containing protein n=1 Tax=Sphingomonas sp. ID0503 TaxID=3399691 RepID=UPI003AFB7679
MKFSFYSPAPRPTGEAHRQAIVDRSGVFEHADDPVLQALVDEAAALCGTPLAAVSIVDNDRQWFVARHGLDARETARAISFCAHAQLGEEVFTVPDAAQDKRFSGNPLVTSGMLRFYAGAPLVSEDGTGIGALCVIDGAPREPLSAEKRARLRELSAKVMARIAEFQPPVSRCA